MNESTPHFIIGINTTNDAMSGSEKVCELYFMDAIYNKQNVNWFTGEVTEESMLKDVIEQVNAVKPTKIIQYIDSWGGSCDVGLGIYNYLRGHSAKVETKILNSCASIATVISAAGNKGKITMPRNGFMVIHQAQTGASGTAKDLREAANVCDAYTNNILDIYERTNRKGKTKAELLDLIKDGDYWMTGQEAKDMGFVDDCYNDESITVTNSIAQAKKIYNNIPTRILAMADTTVTNEIPVEHKNFFTNLLNELKMEVTAIVAKFKADLPNGGTVENAGTKIDFAALLEAPITNMLTAVNEGITAQIAEAMTTATTSVKEGVTNVKEEYKAVFDALTEKVTNLTASVGKLTEITNTQTETIAAQAKTITDLTADVEAQAGKAAPPAGKDTVTDNVKAPKTFAGRTKPTFME